MWILFFSWSIQCLLFALCITLYLHMSVKKKAVCCAAYWKCRYIFLCILSSQTTGTYFSACRYRVSNAFCVPCMKVVSVNNYLNYATCSLFVNYCRYSTVYKMLPDSFLQPSSNLKSSRWSMMKPPTMQQEVPPPKIIICNLIFFNIFHNSTFFLVKNG